MEGPQLPKFGELQARNRETRKETKGGRAGQKRMLFLHLFLSTFISIYPFFTIMFFSSALLFIISIHPKKEKISGRQTTSPEMWWAVKSYLYESCCVFYEPRGRAGEEDKAWWNWSWDQHLCLIKHAKMARDVEMTISKRILSGRSERAASRLVALQWLNKTPGRSSTSKSMPCFAMCIIGWFEHKDKRT